MGVIMERRKDIYVCVSWSMDEKNHCASCFKDYLVCCALHIFFLT